MISKPLVTIMSVSYNQEKYIRETLDSFLMQVTDFKFEILIADDASTDRTPSIIQEYADKHPDIFKPILRKENIGVTQNFMKTLKAASGKYVALCEGDDFWTDTHKLQKQVDFLESNPDHALCFHPIKVFFEKGERADSVWPDISDFPEHTVDVLLKENYIPTNAVLYRRASYDNMPAHIMPVDWYLHVYHAQFGKIGFINETMSAYRRHSQGIWWDSHADKDKLWNTNGIAHLEMYGEFFKLYGNDEKKREIIQQGFNGTLLNIINADRHFDGHLLKTALTTFPDSAEAFINDQNQKIDEQSLQLEEYRSNIEKLNLETIELRSAIFNLRDELHGLTNSRVLGKIIKLRNLIGFFIRKCINSPRYMLRRINDVLRLLASKILPEIVREKLMLFKHRFRRAKSDYIEKLVTYETIENKNQTKGMPLISVVIPYYNRSDTIDETLHSLDMQTYRNFETIIVNDGSNEPDSIEKFKKLQSTRKTTKFIDQKNQGVAAARNNGISQGMGRYVICLDSDDLLETTFIEKTVVMLETNPNISVISTNRQDFGVLQDEVRNNEFDTLRLYSENMIITAAPFRKKAWEKSGGYKQGIGYEDWEYWMNLAEHGYFGRLLPEPLFMYRTSLESRYVQDKDVHWKNMKVIRSLHANYKKNVKKLYSESKNNITLIKPESAFINLNDSASYNSLMNNAKTNVLITIPWMTFGGAETLLYNYCREVKNIFNITFVTGLESKHEWEYKFREITPYIYHLKSLFDDPRLYVEFLDNYIRTRGIDVLHIVHNGFTFAMLPEIRKRHPKLKVILTLFNDRVPEFVKGAIDCQDLIDQYTTDNEAVVKSLAAKLKPGAVINAIPNGINMYEEFNLDHFDRLKERESLGIKDDEIAVFFVGRLSEEKNPDVFVHAAQAVSASSNGKKVKFFIVGDGPMRPEIDTLLKGPHTGNIHYLGYQSEVAKFLSTADIFVLPSKIEGFPLSILEAMAMRVAVIASDVGAVSQVIESGTDGYVVTAGSSEEIVSALMALAGDKKKLQDVKDRAHEKVKKKYSNRILGANYKKLYEGTLK